MFKLSLSLVLVVLVSACGDAGHKARQEAEQARGLEERRVAKEREARRAVRKAARLIGVVCDKFELQWKREGRDLLLAINTDLPDEAQVSVSVSRSYSEVGTSWTSDESRDHFGVLKQAVSRWRKYRRIPIDSAAWRKSLADHQKYIASFGTAAAFKVGRISDKVVLWAHLGQEQEDPRFGGPRNPRLKGAAVKRQKVGLNDYDGFNYAETETTIAFPLE